MKSAQTRLNQMNGSWGCDSYFRHTLGMSATVESLGLVVRDTVLSLESGREVTERDIGDRSIGVGLQGACAEELNESTMFGTLVARRCDAYILD